MGIFDGINSDQLDLCSRIRAERDSLKMQQEEDADFWEWYENQYGQTQKELWDEYQKSKDETNIQK